jgi:uncharacterized membrane protein (UPF0136 family)
MFVPVRIYFSIFGLLAIVGGAIGYVRAGSTVSLISGSVSGLLLLLAALLLPGHLVAGLALGGILSLLLIGYFLPRFLRTGKMMPAGMLSLLSILGMVFVIVAWVRK